MKTYRSEKQAIVAEITDRLKGSGYVLLVGGRGLTVEKITHLRGELRARKARLQVVKNTFFGVAAEQTGYAAAKAFLEGPTAMVTGDMGAVADVAKLLCDFAKDNNLLVIKGGMLGQSLMKPADIEELAKTPPRPVMLGRFLGTLVAPMSNLVGVMNQKLLSVVYALKAVEEKKKAAA